MAVNIMVEWASLPARRSAPSTCLRLPLKKALVFRSLDSLNIHRSVGAKTIRSLPYKTHVVAMSI